jgi:hypothetical protein
MLDLIRFPFYIKISILYKIRTYVIQHESWQMILQINIRFPVSRNENWVPKRNSERSETIFSSPKSKHFKRVQTQNP